MPVLISVAEFQNRLANTQHWCCEKIADEDRDWKNRLRTPELRPPSADEDNQTVPDCWKTDAQHAVAVDFVVRKRTELLHLAATGTHQAAAALASGRLLAYDPSNNDCSGGPYAVSDGYFDFAEVPPWDTWVCFVQNQEKPLMWFNSYLISWVHPSLIHKVIDGMEASPCGSLEWCDKTDTPFADELIRSGLVERH